MTSDISVKAEVSTKAKIGNNCKIYPFAYIEDDVVIGDNCTIYPFVSIMNGTIMGNNNQVFQGTVLGAIPQDPEFTGESTQLVIGNGNTFRENVVVNRATHTGGQTIVGDNNYLMEGAHISHDTKLGNNCVLGYGTKIAGSCEIGNGVIFSSNIVENANTRVGDFVMIQSGTRFAKDVPPYTIIGGRPVEYLGTNISILAQNNIDEKAQKHIANAYRLLFHGQNSADDAAIQVTEQVPDSAEIRNIVQFIQTSKKGLITKI